MPTFRVHIDPAQDGAEIVNGVADRVRAELLRNMKLADQAVVNESSSSESFVKTALNVSGRREIRHVTESI